MLKKFALSAGFAGALAGTLPVSADARMHHPYRGHRIVSAQSAAPPFDGLPVPTAGLSFRKLRSAHAGSAIRLRRASDNLELDINFLGYVPGLGSPWDSAAATAHCAATQCFAAVWYDQSGAGRNWTQATAANQPELIFNCIGFLPCLRTALGAQAMAGASLTPATGVVSFSVVANRASGTAVCGWLRQNGTTGNRLISQGGAPNAWQVTPGALTATSADGTWHAAQGVMNGATSVIAIDNVEVTGSTAATVTAGVPGMQGGAGTVCEWGEVAFWDNYAMTPAERSVLTLNQRGFWLP